MTTVQKKVLVIDDQLEIRELVEATLQSPEISVIQAANGRTGLKKAKQERPDLILLDVMMPDFDGIETCQVLKRDPETRYIPVVFLTAKNAKRDVQSAIMAGGIDYITKPFSPDLLTKRVLKNLPRYAALSENPQADTAGTKSLMTLPSEIDVKQEGGVMILRTGYEHLNLDCSQPLQTLFQDLLASGATTIVMDLSHVRTIDGMSLGLLVSLQEELQRRRGGLRVCRQTRDFNRFLSLMKISEMFHPYATTYDAAAGFSEPEKQAHDSTLNICMTCTYLNEESTRVCRYCGADLIVWKGAPILRTLQRSMVRSILKGIPANEVRDLNRLRNMELNESLVPDEFVVEIQHKEMTLSYVSAFTDAAEFEEHKRIAIQAPMMYGRPVELSPHLPVVLSIKALGDRSRFGTRILQITDKGRMLVVKYTGRAREMHTQKYFTVTPGQPIPVLFRDPSLNSSCTDMHGSILEIGLTRMIVETEQPLPLNTCLAARFTLPSGSELTTPLVIARKGESPGQFFVDFTVMHERERSELLQYANKRQVENAKVPVHG